MIKIFELILIMTLSGNAYGQGPLPPQLRNSYGPYPPQAGLVQWLKGSPLTTHKGSLSEPTVAWTNATSFAITQTDFGILPSINLGDVQGFQDVTAYYAGDLNGKPKYVFQPGAIPEVIVFSHPDGTWEYDIVLSPLGHTNAATTTFPPETGWVAVGLDPLELTLPNTPWIDSGEFATLTYTDLIAFTNDTDSVRVSYNPSNGQIKNVLTYEAPMTNTVLNLYLRIFK